MKLWIVLPLLICLLSPTRLHAEHYAVLISGEKPDSNAYGPAKQNNMWNDLFLTWEMLWTYGWKDKNIYVLFSDGEEPADWPINNQRYEVTQLYEDWEIEKIVDFTAFRADVDSIFTWLAYGDAELDIPQMTADDFLFVWTFGHGTPNLLKLAENDSITASQLAALMDFCDYNQRVIYMQQCHSGSFINELANDSTVIMTAVSNFQSACAADDSLPDAIDPTENEYIAELDTFYHEECFYHMVNAVRLKTIVGNTFPAHPDSSPDTDQDGLTSLLEIWNWVDSTNTYLGQTTPQYSDPGSIGDTTFLNIPPYTPTGFYGTIVDDLAVLRWNPNTEYDLDHYDIYCKLYNHETQQTSFWFLLATTSDTTYTDSSFAPHNGSDADTAWYKITARDLADLSSDCTNVVSAPGEIRPADEGLLGVINGAEGYIVSDNYPEPFNPSTTITYILPEATLVRLCIYDITGRKIATLINQYLSAGKHQAVFDGSDFPSGIYLYQLNADSHTTCGKMVMLK
ncbi:MAG: C13 family peptidase [bacterium]